MQINVDGIDNIPIIKPGDDLGNIICEALTNNNIQLLDNDVLCVASKIVSISENRIVNLNGIIPSEKALEIHDRVLRKDSRIIQLMIDESGDLSGSKLDVSDNYIGCWLKSGLKLTSAGIDKIDENYVVLLPNDSNLSAKQIANTLFLRFKKNVGVVITDSDGREDKVGATQVAIGVYGVPPLRNTVYFNNGKKKIISETICDMMAATAGLIMGQRGKNIPAVIIRGYNYTFDTHAKIEDALCINKNE